MNEFLTAHVLQINFEKTLMEVDSPYLYASYGTFCIQIGQSFETHWVFEECLNIDKLKVLKENVVVFELFEMFKDSLWLEYLTILDVKSAGYKLAYEQLIAR